MRHLEFERVQGQTVEVPRRAIVTVDVALAVAHVAHERMGQVFEVAADLVKPAGLGPRFDEAAAVARTADQFAAPRHRIHTRAVFALWHGMIDLDLLRRLPSHERHVSFLNRRSGERLAQDPCDFGTESEQQHTTGRSIQAMYGVDVFPGLSPRPDQSGRFGSRHPARMHSESRRFVHGQNVCVEVQERRCGRHIGTVTAPVQSQQR